MKLEDFQTLLHARLSADAFFTDAPAVSVQKQLNRDIRKTIQSALSGDGVIVAVGLPDCERTENEGNDEFEFLCDIEFFENPTQNDSGKSAFQCLDHARGNLEGKSLDEELSPLRVVFAGFSREQDGISIFRLRIRSLANIGTTPDP